MYIEPNTNIKLLRYCPFDNTYTHTIYFESKTAQTNYFSGLAKYSLTSYSYQRVNNNTMRVQYKAEDLYDCNYMMFQNASFGNKWFYAFINSVNYINNITSEITYEIDVMQTWLFDYVLHDCFVDREHSYIDDIGGNTVPEDVELGDYVSDDFDGTQKMGQKSIVVAATFNEKYEDIGGNMYSGLFSGLYYNVFPNTLEGATACAEFIRNAGSKTDGIVCVFLMPTNFITSTGEQPKTFDITKDKNNIMLRADGREVKNKKLLTYPYNFLYVTNLQGNHGIFHYEYFANDTCDFILAGDMSPNSSFMLVPKNYKGVVVNYDEKMVLSGFPQLSYNTDSFKAWLAQSASSLFMTSAVSPAANSYIAQERLSMLSNQATAALGAKVTAIGAGLQCAQAIGNMVQHFFMPDQARGGQGSQTLAALGLLDFAFMHKHIRPEFVSIIDDYFNMYGYATKRVKKPNRNARPHWTYTRTIGCDIHGGIPNDDARRICDIYDNGITFWKNGNEIGDYSLDNSPVAITQGDE